MDSYDRVEDLAQCMCEAAGGCWHGKGTKRAYWRDKAAGALAASDAADLPYGLGDMPTWALVVTCSGWMVGALAAAWAVLT